MSIRAFTHTIAMDGHCRDCGEPLVTPELLATNPHAGDRIGKIETKHGGARVYRIGEHDTNPPCKPI